jgi:hypothetical protein
VNTAVEPAGMVAIDTSIVLPLVALVKPAAPPVKTGVVKLPETSDRFVPSRMSSTRLLKAVAVFAALEFVTVMR